MKVPFNSVRLSPIQPSLKKRKEKWGGDNQNICAGDMMLAIGIDKDKQKRGRLHDGVSFNAFIIGHDEGVDSFVLRGCG